MTLPLDLHSRHAALARASLVALLGLACAQGDARPAAGDTSPAERLAADSVVRARADSVNRATPGYVVDSIHSTEEELRRFRAEIAEPPHALANGADSRDALVRRWVSALESRDSVTLIRLAVNRAEFAFLIYPDSPLGRPPYHQPPAMSWLHLSNGSVQGFRRSVNALGGKSLSVLAYSCAPEAERQGANRIWNDCRVRRLRAPGDTVVQRLFGSIVERGGRFKFLSLANDL